MPKFIQGQYSPKNIEKYKGNINKITYRSSWERAVMVWLDMNPAVLEWSSESLSIQYWNPTKNRPANYFPDFYAKIKNKSGLVEKFIMEVKPSKETKPPEFKPRARAKTKLYESNTWIVNQEKWRAAIKFCALHGFKFKLLTEHTLNLG